LSIIKIMEYLKNSSLYASRIAAEC